MIQAVDGFSSREPMPSTGQNAKASARPSTGKIEINSGGDIRAEIVDELASADADRLNAIASRAQGLKTLMGVLSFSPEMSEEAQDLFRMVGREADAIFALAIQPYDAWRTVQ